MLFFFGYSNVNVIKNQKHYNMNKAKLLILT